MVGRQSQRRHGVHVVHPRAFLVAPDFHVVLRVQYFASSIPKSGQSGETLVLHDLIMIHVVIGGFDLPDSDFVVLVGAEEFVIGVNYHEGLDGAVSGGYEVVVTDFLLVVGVVPGADFAVGGAGVEEFAGEGEAGYVGGGGGAFEGGDAVVVGGGGEAALGRERG